jgi:[ribosomal protein S5]-alanine N-acetyltransferase
MTGAPTDITLFPTGSLESSRLRIRPLAETDAAFILKLVNERGFLQNIGDKGVRTLDDAREYIRSGAMASYERYGFGLSAVELKPSMDPIGMCGLLQRDSLDAPDLGYALLEQHWAKGYTFEAATLVLKDAQTRLGLKRILAIISLDNIASERVLEKLGFRFIRVATLQDSADPTKVFEWAPR